MSGIALRAALGAGLPPTRKEDEWMGRRDEILAHAEAAQGAAKKEVKRQDLDSLSRPKF